MSEARARWFSLGTSCEVLRLDITLNDPFYSTSLDADLVFPSPHASPTSMLDYVGTTRADVWRLLFVRRSSDSETSSPSESDWSSVLKDVDSVLLCSALSTRAFAALNQAFASRATPAPRVLASENATRLAATVGAKVTTEGLILRSCAPRERVSLCLGLTATSHPLTSHKGRYVWHATDWLLHRNGHAAIAVCAGRRGPRVDPPPFARCVLLPSSRDFAQAQKLVSPLSEWKRATRERKKSGELAHVWVARVELTPEGLDAARRLVTWVESDQDGAESAGEGNQEEDERVTIGLDALSDKVKALLAPNESPSFQPLGAREGRQILLVAASEFPLVWEAASARGASLLVLRSVSENTGMRLFSEEDGYELEIPSEWTQEDFEQTVSTIRNHRGEVVLSGEEEEKVAREGAEHRRLRRNREEML